MILAFQVGDPHVINSPLFSMELQGFRDGIMSPELETLDQLLTGDIPLLVVRKLFHDDAHCRIAITRLVDAGDIQLLDENDQPLPVWQRRIVLNAVDVSAWQHHRVRITSKGVNRIS